ncbi:MAG: ribosome maturation factor RimP [Acidobacteria bacterium]|nr:ribosome maturation factor RimP [Acidobacteriota bacterium]MBI3261987.1 ribosome maturation factor RimP [Acidobacteriota bacterium]
MADPLPTIRAAAERVAASSGLELFDVQFRRESSGWVLRVILDRPAEPDGARPVAEATTEGRPAVEGVTLGDCQRVSQDLSAILDVEDVIDRQYTLEVTSPGLDRPLRHEADYRRFAGRLAKIVVARPVDGQSHFAGRLRGVEDGTVLVEVGRDKVKRIPLALIARSRLDVEF